MHYSRIHDPSSIESVLFRYFYSGTLLSCVQKQQLILATMDARQEVITCDYIILSKNPT